VIVVDASVWVSRVVADDVHHGATRPWLDRYLLESRAVTCPLLLLAEVAGSVVRRTGRPHLAERAIDDIRALATLRLVPVGLELAMQAAQLAGDLRLRGADAVYVATAHLLSVPLVTWDRDQLDRSSVVIEAYEPGAEPS